MPECPNPNGGPPETLFSATRQPSNNGRTPTKFLRDILGKPVSEVPSAEEFRQVAKLTGQESVREAFVARLMQIAFTDKVIVVGHDRVNDVPIERVSSAECLKAIAMLQHYDMGKPVESKEVSGPGGGPLRVAPITTAEQRALLERLMSEPEDGKEPDGSPGGAQG